MKKRFVCLITMILFIAAICIPAQAVEPRIATAIPQLSFSGTTAICKVSIIDTGKAIDATLELWQGNTLVDSWPGSGTSVVSISGSCTVTKGVTYTLKVTGTSGGVTISSTPVSKTC